MSVQPKRRFGVCWVPRVAHGWTAPSPTIRSWQALRSIGITDLRLTYDPALIPVFASDLRNAHAAGLRINANFGAIWEDNGKRVAPDPKIIEAEAGFLASEFGGMIDLYTFDNEPLADIAGRREHQASGETEEGMKGKIAAFVKSLNWYAFCHATLKPGASIGNRWQIVFRFITRPLNDAVRVWR